MCVSIDLLLGGFVLVSACGISSWAVVVRMLMEQGRSNSSSDVPVLRCSVPHCGGTILAEQCL